MTKRLLVFLFGIASYLVFFASVLYGIGFIGNVFVPKSLDTGDASLFATALLVDVGLIVLFGLQHSVMARRSFKDRLTQWIPEPMERSVYVLVSSLALMLVFWQWRAIPELVWEVGGVPGGVLQAVFWAAWALVMYATFAINHFDLFGLRQVYLYLRGIDYTPVEFRQPAIYRYVRHPLMFGFLLAFWATPRMSIGHLVFAAGMTAYILVGIALEERDLLKAHGQTYEEYRRQVSMLLPMRKKK
jgi:methanethiol S-methyltransferase